MLPSPPNLRKRGACQGEVPGSPLPASGRGAGGRGYAWAQVKPLPPPPPRFGEGEKDSTSAPRSVSLFPNPTDPEASHMRHPPQDRDRSGGRRRVPPRRPHPPGSGPGADRQAARDEVQRGQGDRPRRLLPLLVHQRRPTRRSRSAGSNNIWVVFKDYVVVIDANFPKEAADVLAAIKKTTDKPIKLRPRHAPPRRPRLRQRRLGQGRGQDHRSDELRPAAASANGPKAVGGRRPRGRKPQGRRGSSELKQVDDSRSTTSSCSTTARSGSSSSTSATPTRSATRCAYLPKHKILCTGDACVNGAFNYMGHSNSASWIQCLEKMQKLDVKHRLPRPRADRRQGPARHAEALLRGTAATRCKKGIDAKKSLEDITAGHRHAVVQGVDRQGREGRTRTTSSTSTRS